VRNYREDVGAVFEQAARRAVMSEERRNLSLKVGAKRGDWPQWEGVEMGLDNIQIY
jgi:hypothetical protein